MESSLFPHSAPSSQGITTATFSGENGNPPWAPPLQPLLLVVFKAYNWSWQSMLGKCIYCIFNWTGIHVEAWSNLDWGDCKSSQMARGKVSSQSTITYIKNTRKWGRGLPLIGRVLMHYVTSVSGCFMDINIIWAAWEEATVPYCFQ